MKRFWEKVDKNGPKGCWVWRAGKCDKGYGRFGMNGKNTGAHRVSYELTNGKIPAGLYIDHICRNPSCVNPKHLRAVTPRINALENSISFAAINANKKICDAGHPLSGENLRRSWDNRSQRWIRVCKTCSNAKARLRHAQKPKLKKKMGRKRLPDKTRLRVKELRTSGETMISIATKVGVSEATVWNILKEASIGR